MEALAKIFWNSTVMCAVISAVFSIIGNFFKVKILIDVSILAVILGTIGVIGSLIVSEILLDPIKQNEGQKRRR